MAIETDNQYVSTNSSSVYAAQPAQRYAQESAPQAAEEQAGSTGTASVYAPPATGSHIDTYA